MMKEDIYLFSLFFVKKFLPAARVNILKTHWKLNHYALAAALTAGK
jgi:hypothetical protein